MRTIQVSLRYLRARDPEAEAPEALISFEPTRLMRPRPSCSVCVLLPCVLLAGDLSKEVNEAAA